MLDSFKLAFKSIKANKVRSFLTMLGIIIGVSSVIILVSIVSGFMKFTVDNFIGMGANEITVYLGDTGPRSPSVSQMVSFYEDNKDVFSFMSPIEQVGKELLIKNTRPKSVVVLGVSDSYQKMQQYQMQEGRFISYSDIDTRQKVAVIGNYLAVNGFGSAEKAIGEKVYIDGTAYKVIGVVQQMDMESSPYGKDNFCNLPYTVACNINNISTPKNYKYVIKEPGMADNAVSMLDDFLYKIYQNPQKYSVSAMTEMLDSMNSQVKMLSMILGGIAGISLLVAGVGVMNIMLVSVRERTREIGIRKALGAKRKAIMGQFLIEAAVMSLGGGIIGIIVGSAVSYSFGSGILGVPTPPTPQAVTASFLVSVIIGLIFGYAPASRAAKMKPIDALNGQ